MVLRLRIGPLLAFLATAGAVVALASPAAGTAHAATCQKLGARTAAKLSHPQARRAIRCLVNKRREAHGLHRLKSDRRLNAAAGAHTRFMNRHGCFSHQCPGELSPLARLKRVGYLVPGLLEWAYGENIAWGSRRLGKPRAIVRAWMHSPEHRRNILDPAFQEIGVGFGKGYPGHPDGPGGTYTTDFGMRRG
jgi:uncharacterized protein YkwD